MISPSRGPERLVRAGPWLIAYVLIQMGGAVITDRPNDCLRGGLQLQRDCPSCGTATGGPAADGAVVAS